MLNVYLSDETEKEEEGKYCAVQIIYVWDNFSILTKITEIGHEIGKCDDVKNRFDFTLKRSKSIEIPAHIRWVIDRRNKRRTPPQPTQSNIFIYCVIFVLRSPSLKSRQELSSNKYIIILKDWSRHSLVVVYNKM